MTSTPRPVGDDRLPEEIVLPQTAAGRQAAAFLDALNTGDLDKMRAFIAEHSDASLLTRYPIEAVMQWASGVYRSTGGVSPHAVDYSADGEISLHARARRGDALYRLTLRVAPEPPHHVTHLDAVRAADKLIDVGGYRLAVTSVGRGRPTVVLDAGLEHSSGLTWVHVLDAVAELTHVVSYDRAGLGQSDSDPASRPRTSQQIVMELHTLLNNAGIAGPYVLVGFSFGGFNVRLYAHHYPDDVAGIVLVSSSNTEQRARFLEILPPETPGESPMLTSLRRDSERLADPTKNTEGINWIASEAQVRAAGSFGDKPLVVITQGVPQWPPDFPAEVAARLLQARREMHRSLVQLSSESTHVVADKSGHVIPYDQPDLVVAAIRQVVEAVRDKDKLQNRP